MSASVPMQDVSDEAARAAAIDPATSGLVQAPAGSGKTDLLTLRYLALLPTVAEPEQVLAITFTRKATAEMRARVLSAFAAARRGAVANENEHQRRLREHAAAALAHAAAREWNLEGQPQRLNIQTIDSLALSIAYEMPLLSRLGGQLNPVDDATAQYTLAAQRTLALLGSGHPELDAAVAEVLRLRDASLGECEALLARLLASREQWLLLLPQVAQSQPVWAELRSELESPFLRERDAVLPRLRQRLRQHLPELLELARIGAANGMEHLSVLDAIASAEELVEVAHWQCLCKMLLLTDSDAWRRKIDKSVGFPATTHRAEGDRLKQWIASLADDDSLLKLLCRARALPPVSYSEQEWRVVESIFVLFRRAVAELRVVFAEQNVIDFAEAGIAAHAALADPGVQMRREDRFRHVLVDEFQDTSRAQHALLRALLQEWQQEDGRTCFFVGDPMQSIYLFRQAEASLFGHIRQHGLELEGSHIDVTPLALSTNFRSTPAMVEPLNDVFARVLVEDDADGVGYAAAVSSKAAAEGADADALYLHVQLAAEDQPATATALQEAQAEAVLRAIRAHLPAMEQAERDGTKYRVAVLVRTRAHLPEILARLRQESIRFRGVKIEPLAERPEILDLLSLLRALLHPADRIAWLAVLRAPWCGLTLPALHAICGDQDRASQSATIAELLRQNSERLSAADHARALSVLAVLEQAAAAYADGLLSTTPSALSLWLERTWHALGAPAFLDAQARANSEVFFSALGRLAAGSMGVLDAAFNRALEQLYAEPDPAASEHCGVQVMTIHGAKGLEFEVVLVPGLERAGRGEDAELFRSLVRRHADDGGDELLLAPLGRKHDETPALYRWVGSMSSQRLRQEDKRLLYVACSRAIRELHLFAAVERDRAGALRSPRTGSLLAAGWDGLASRLEAALAHAADSDEADGKAATHDGTTVANLFQMPRSADSAEAGVLAELAAAGQGQRLLRLPQSWFTATPAHRPAPETTQRPSAIQLHSAADHPARIRGTVLHALLAHAATLDPLPRADDPRWNQITAALLRQHAVGTDDTALLREAVLSGLRNTLNHADGRWLLTAAASALNESSWTRMSGGRLERHRPDRIFAAGATPRAPGEECLWIIDYKTGKDYKTGTDYKTGAPAQGEERDAFLAQSREHFRPQLEMYSRVLRAADAAQGQQPHRLAIYYPALPFLDWWPA
jgi:ATP-dependent helicase/nuclease subunit A